MKTIQFSIILPFAILGLLIGCTTSIPDDSLTLASGSAENPFGGDTITLASFENGAGELSIAPSNYDFTYPDVEALPEYDVYLYSLGDDPITEIYAYDASMTPSSGTTGPDFEGVCDQNYEEFDYEGQIVQICHNTGTTCHSVETSEGTTIIVRCPKE